MDRFDALFAAAVVSAVFVLALMGKRYGTANAICFVILSGLFTAVMDFLSAFAIRTYEYPGQTPLWVFGFIFVGWIAIGGSCVLLAEGIVLGGRRVLDVPDARWQVANMTGMVAVALDLFMDPVAVKLAIWVWTRPGNVYFGIPLYNFVGWHNLMTFAPAVWLLIVTRPGWSPARRVIMSLVAVPPTMVVSGAVTTGVMAVIKLTPWW